MEKVKIAIKDFFNELKIFYARAFGMLTSCKAFTRAPTMIRTIGSFGMYILALICLVPFALDTLSNIVFHIPMGILSSGFYWIGEKIHGEY